MARTKSGGCDQKGVSEPPLDKPASAMFARPHAVPMRLRPLDQPGRFADSARPTATAATTTETDRQSEAHGSCTLTP